MAVDENVALEIVNGIAEEGKFPKKIVNLMYRSEAKDYVILLEDDSVCLIREKLINTFHENKDGDVKREILGRLKNAEKVEINAPPPPQEDKISVEDDL